jgi:hypothetical protein
MSTINRQPRTWDRYFWRGALKAGLLTTAVGAMVVQGCGGDSDLRCGEGTIQRRSRCLPAEDGSGGSSAGGVGASGGIANPGPDAGTGGRTPVTQESFDFEGIQSAAPAGPDGIQLAWLPAEYPERPLANIQYAIYAATQSGAQNFSEPTALAPPGSTSFLIDGLDEGDELHFVVRAFSEDGPARDENREEMSATAQPDTTAPTFAGATSAEPAGPAEVRVSWDAADDDLTPAAGIVYQVFWSETEADLPRGTLGAVSLPGATSVVVRSLPVPETVYYFRVTAVDAAGNTTDGDAIVSAAAGADDVPPVFGGCRALVDPRANGVTVLWDPATDDTTPTTEILYKIYAFKVPVDEDTTFAEPAGTFTDGATAGQLRTLDEATRYRIVCRAEDKFGNEDANLVTRTFDTLNDGTPPEFGGLASVEIGSTEAVLNWTAATDDQSDPADIVYEVYLALAADAFDFAVPFAESLPGVTSMNIFNIPSNRQLYFIVRARDEAGNVDENTNVVSAKSLVSFDRDIQPILNQSCAVTTCHVPPAPPQGQSLVEGAAYVNIVDVIARQGTSLNPPEPELKRVDSSSSDPHDSYLWRKVTGTPPYTGALMPADENLFLTPEQLEALTDWIIQGAQNN